MTDENKNQDQAIGPTKKNDVKKTTNEAKQDVDNHQHMKSDLKEIFKEKLV